MEISQFSRAFFGSKRAVNERVIAHALIEFEARKISLSRIENSNIAIVGAQGFIGSWILCTLFLIREFFELDFKITAIQRNNPDDFRTSSSTKFLVLDLADGMLDYSEYTHIVHLANAHESILRSDLDFNSSISMRVMEQILQSCRQDSRVLFASSGAVYGNTNPPDMGFEESMVSFANEMPSLNNLSDYGKLKWKIEKKLLLANESEIFSGVAARIFSVYGPKLPTSKNFAIGNFMQNSRERRTIVVNGLGTSLRNYLHGIDLGIDMVALLFRDYVGSINLGGNQTLSVMQVAEMISQQHDVPIQIRGMQGLDRAYFPNLSKLNSLFPDRSQIDFKYGIANWGNVEINQNKI